MKRETIILTEQVAIEAALVEWREGEITFEANVALYGPSPEAIRALQANISKVQDALTARKWDLEGMAAKVRRA